MMNWLSTFKTIGTESSCTIDYEVTNNAETGYLGIVSEHGVMEFGKIDEAEKKKLSAKR